MNVYVREMVSSLSQAGVECTTYTRADREGLPDEIVVEPNHRVVFVEAGPHHLPKEALPEMLDEFTDAVLADITATGGADVVHANYWLSGVVAHRIKHVLDIPFVSTFHTLARVKAEGGDPEPGWRDRAETELINCADAVCVSCVEEEQQFRRLYGDPNGRIEIIAPGVEHAFFAPGEQSGARAAIDLPTDVPVILFVGRIQPFKGPDVAIRALDELDRPDALLADRRRGQRRRGRQRARACAPTRPRARTGRPGSVRATRSRTTSCPRITAPPTWSIVPESERELRSRRPRGGGLRHPGRGQRRRRFAVTGRRRRDRLPRAASRSGVVRRRRRQDPRRPAAGGVDVGRRRRRAKRYTWSFAAARLRRLYTDLTARQLVVCAVTDLHHGERLDDLRRRIDGWLDAFADDNPLIASVDRGTSDDTSLGEPRWYVRMLGDEKDFTTVWLTLGQRTLRYETYVMPAPEENSAAVMEVLLRRNETLVGVHFSIGDEDAIYLRGEIPDVAVDEAELDRVLGTVYTTVEANFRPLLRLAFASRFGG